MEVVFNRTQVIIIGITMCLLVVLVGWLFYKVYIKKQKYDGLIVIHKIDEKGHAQMELGWGVEYEELMKRDYLIFEVENHITNHPSQNSQSL